jgi:predicted CXXCH cytochrome family protein
VVLLSIKFTKNGKLALLILLTVIAMALYTVITTNAQGRSDEYVGSETCITCHEAFRPELIDKWNASGHGGYGGNAYPLTRGIDCSGCHSTNYDPDTNTYTEARQGCEVCHGPGKTHYSGPSTDNIYQPTDSSVCGQCHNRHGTSQTYNDPESGEPVGYPVGYTPDQTLEDFYLSAPLDDLHSFWPSGHASYSHGGGGMQYPEWVQSSHSQAKVECFTCHDPHGSVGYDYQLVEPVDSLCIACHTTQEKLNEGTGGAGVPDLPWVMEDMCVGCHMPPVGITHSGDPGTGRSHLYQVLDPGEAEEFAMLGEDTEPPEGEEEEHIEIPASSCTECHSTEADYYAARFQDLIDDRRAETATLLTSLSSSLSSSSYLSMDAQALVEMAQTNVDLVTMDKSSGWHNYYYAISLLNEADQLLDRAADVEEYVTSAEELESEKMELETMTTELSNQVTSLEDQVGDLQAEVDDLTSKVSGGSTNLILGAVVGLIIGAVAVYFIRKQ